MDPDFGKVDPVQAIVANTNCDLPRLYSALDREWEKPLAAMVLSPVLSLAAKFSAPRIAAIKRC